VFNTTEHSRLSGVRSIGETMSIAVFISGNGTNLQALLEYNLPIAFVASNNADAYGLVRARNSGIPTYVEETALLRNFERMVNEKCKEHNIKLIVLAGFMRILTPTFVNKWSGKIVNIHPSLLPAFKGKTAIQDAFEYGVKVTGVTIHYVDKGMDTGQIITQEPVYMQETIEQLEESIHVMEYAMYPPTVKKIYNQLLNK
jgi:phosphoribosylglycinamide formyltransferase-1